MDRIKRFRHTQEETLEQFSKDNLDSSTCNNCLFHQECLESMGDELMESLTDYGCSGFETNPKLLKQAYLRKYQIATT